MPAQLLKGRGNPVKSLAHGNNKQTYRLTRIFTLFLYNAED